MNTDDTSNDPAKIPSIPNADDHLPPDKILPFEEASTPVAEGLSVKQRKQLRLGLAVVAMFLLSVLFFGYGSDEPAKNDDNPSPENKTSSINSAKHETPAAPTLPQSAEGLALSREQTARLKALLGNGAAIPTRESLDEQAQSRAARLSANSDVLSTDNRSVSNNRPEAEYLAETPKDEDTSHREPWLPQKIAVAQASRGLHLSTTVLQGTLLKATLETQIHSDLPGMVRAMTSENVYAQDNSQCLIPWGSQLVGHYVNHIMQGQNRIFIVWQRLIRPDGITVALTSHGTDPLGGSGVLADEIDRHFWQQWGMASLLSVIGVSTNTGKTHKTDNTTAIDAYRQALSESFRDSAAHTLETQGNIQPTLTVHHGTPISVFIARDLDFYQALGS